MEILIFAVIGVGFFTALFLIDGFYRKWQLTNRHVSIYLVACLSTLFLAVNIALTRENILVEQGDFFLRDIRRGILVIIFVLVYLPLRSILIDYFDTLDRVRKGWLTHGALVLALFYFWTILAALSQGVMTQRGHLPMDIVNELLMFAPLILVLILYLIGRRFLPQKHEN